MSNANNSQKMNLEVEMTTIKGDVKLVSQSIETTNERLDSFSTSVNKSLDEIKNTLWEINNSVPPIRNTVSQVYDKVISLETAIAKLTTDNQANTDFRKQASVDLARLIEASDQNTTFRQQAEVIIRLVKWMGLPTIASIIYLYIKLITDGKI